MNPSLYRVGQAILSPCTESAPAPPTHPPVDRMRRTWSSWLELYKIACPRPVTAESYSLNDLHLMPRSFSALDHCGRHSALDANIASGAPFLRKRAASTACWTFMP